jgi:hypothetical protein
MILATACSDYPESGLQKDTAKENLEVWDMGFDDDYKNFWIDVRIKDDFAPTPAIIDDMGVVVKEMTLTREEVDERAQPTLKGRHSIISDFISKRGQHALILADLTLSEKQVRKQMILTGNIRKVFPDSSLHVAFIKGNELTETYPVTDYVLENFFVPVTDKNAEKRVYRAMLSKLNEMNGKKDAFYRSVKQDSVWKGLTSRQKVMIVCSDGRTYLDDTPIDPEHFELQQLLLGQDSTVTSFPIFYVDYQDAAAEDAREENNAEDLMSILTNRSGGEYVNSSAWFRLSRRILKLENDSCADIRIYLENPDKKVYRGLQRWLKVELTNSDTVYAVGYKNYALGSVYNPVIVGGVSNWHIIIQGVVISLCLLLITYLIFQYIVPWIRYRLFLRKYVTRYAGRNMGFNGMQIDEVCYFCKAPFNKGDMIVARCEHVMHKSCWDENEYKCPEYGRRCKTGSHYYNMRKLHDTKNAPYYMKWLLAGIVAGALAWLCFVANIFGSGYESLIHLVSEIPNLSSGHIESENMVRHGLAELSHTPYFGLYICFFMTLFLSMLSSHGAWRWERIVMLLSKAVVAGCCGFISFVLAVIVKHVFNLSGNIVWIDWIPWALNGFMVACIVSYSTDIKLSKSLFGALLSVVSGIGAMYIWYYSIDSQMDSRDLLLICSLIYSVGLAVCLASQSPKSERYFLRIEGAIKTMEVALYKWMNAQVTNRKVTIGKSVDCNLQMSWDINSQIAPIHAKLISSRGNIYLIACEEGVVCKGKRARVDKRIRLYHGDRFSIGQTTFTYVEHNT